MTENAFSLLANRRFLPLFVTQFCGALNDNLFKNALVILATYRLADAAGVNVELLATAAGGIFILPFFLFSATAGRLADRFEKSLIIRLVKVSEILIMALGALGFALANVWLLLAVLFLMGTHSAFFGPLKYGILPQHLALSELLAGNALVEAGTFLAILLGTIGGGVLVLVPGGIAIVSAAVLGVAVLGLAASSFIPRADPLAAGLPIDFRLFRHTAEILRDVRREPVVFCATLGISWFWLVGATFLAQVPAYTKLVIRADEHVVTLFLTAFSVGIALGSLLANRLLRGEISARHVPWGALGIALFGIDLYFASGAVPVTAGALAGIGEFLATVAGWRVVVDLALVAVSGGVFIVPLYALLQSRGDPAHRSRIIAGNNVMNALFMVTAALASGAMLTLRFTIPQVFLAVALLTLLVAVAAFRLVRSSPSGGSRRAGRGTGGSSAISRSGR